MYVGYLLTAGILPLVMYWCPQWYIKCTHTQAKLADATKVLLKVKQILLPSIIIQYIYDTGQDCYERRISKSPLGQNSLLAIDCFTTSMYHTYL